MFARADKKRPSRKAFPTAVGVPKRVLKYHGTPQSDRRFDIGPRKIIANEQQRAGVRSSKVIGEAIAKIQPCRVNTFAPLPVSLCNAPRRCQRHENDLKPESIYQFLGFFPDIAPARNDQRLGDRSCRNQQAIGSGKRRHTGLCLGFIEKDGHQRGGIDDDHSGKPPSS